MDALEADRHDWRQGVDLDDVELAMIALQPLLEAVAANGASMLIRVDGERIEGVRPKIFTVAVHGADNESQRFRIDHWDLNLAVKQAVAVMDAWR